MPDSLRDGLAGYLMDIVAAKAVPLQDFLMDIYGLCKCLVALGVIGVDRLPRRKDERRPVKRVLGEYCFQFFAGHRRDLLKHSKCVDESTIKKDPLGCLRLSDVLLYIPGQDLVREFGRPWASRQTTRQPLGEA